MKERQRGIAIHIEKFQSTELSAAETPNQNLLNSLKSLQDIKNRKEQAIINDLQLHTEISKQISYEQAKRLVESKEKLRQNEKILIMVELCKEIDAKTVAFERFVEPNSMERHDKIRQMLACFKQLYDLIEKLDEQFNGLSKFDKKEVKDLPFSMKDQIDDLRKKYFKSLKAKLYKGIVEMFYSSKRTQEIEASLKYFQLPIKKSNKKRELELQSQLNQVVKDQNYYHQAYTIISALFCEYCCYCLQKKIQMILDEEEAQLKMERQSVIGENNGLEDKVFVSPFFKHYWQKIGKSISYIFINLPSLHQENSAYQIDEPNWLFEYMEEVFTSNFTFINNNILAVLKGQSETKQIIEYIRTYFISFNILNFFLKFILMRLETDTSVLKEAQRSNKKITTDQKNRNSFIIFNFLDELNVLSEKISQNFDYEPNFIESVLLWADKNSSLDILAMNFDYEHEWIEERIFHDFSNINYSSISDLKNVQAYNITVNFTHIFEKLYSKFRKIKDENIKPKINQFYYEKLLQLVRHIVTSFERIYNYSGIDKYETLVSYKKVEDEFRGYFNGFIEQSPAFEQKINEEYYSILQKYVSVLALEQLTNSHKKVYKRLSDNNDAFTLDNFQPQDLSSNKTKWNKIFEEWQGKITKLRKLEPHYEDKKMRNIFFVFLQSIQFSEDGFLYFMSLFEPFLVVMFSVEGTNTIKMLLEMEKGTLKEYCKTHQNNLWFLSSNELRSIEKAKIRSSHQ